MSLVGPRPYLPRQLEKMGGYRKTILKALPGMTDLWQVSGKSELTFEAIDGHGKLTPCL